MKIATLFFFLGISVAAICAAPDANYAWHTVQKGETMYSISRMYGIKPAELAAYNDAVGASMSIKVGQKLRVPASADEKAEAPVPAPVKPAQKPVAVSEAATSSPATGDIVHVVRKGETFYSVARLYEVDRNDLQMWNELEDLNLKLGQKLVIHRSEHERMVKRPEPVKENAPAANAPAHDDEVAQKTPYLNIIPTVKEPNVSTNSGDATASSISVGLASSKTVKSWKTESATDRMENARASTRPAYDAASEYESVYYQSVYSGLAKRSERGVAKLTQDNNQAYIAYYNNAAVGTILKLTNADNGKSTYAVVVGKVPDIDTGAYMVKLSDRVARTLSLKDYNSVELVCYTGN
ncbi:MAG: LysM peptidoglycan-binding domain-containing protein [Bacteroidetes bacterium]|nr:LysM peptidoglycan-binding domain-containing protein [Bacteroidota bacterium]